MLDKIKQAQRMWAAGNTHKTHKEIKEVTGLSHEVEYAVTELGVSADVVFSKLPLIKPGMKAKEIKEVLSK